MPNRIGVYVCHCGTNIAGKVDSPGVAEFAKSLPGVVVSRDYKFMCSDPGQDLIIKDIKEMGLTRVVLVVKAHDLPCHGLRDIHQFNVPTQ